MAPGARKYRPMRPGTWRTAEVPTPWRRSSPTTASPRALSATVLTMSTRWPNRASDTPTLASAPPTRTSSCGLCSSFSRPGALRRSNSSPKHTTRADIATPWLWLGDRPEAGGWMVAWAAAQLARPLAGNRGYRCHCNAGAGFGVSADVTATKVDRAAAQDAPCPDAVLASRLTSGVIPLGPLVQRTTHSEIVSPGRGYAHS